MTEFKFKMFTDGACVGNPGPGGYCAILLAFKDGKLLKQVNIVGGEQDTTNNRMELRAVIEGLKALTKEEVSITIVTDSEYVMKGITERIANWKKKGWRISKTKPLKNVDLWQELDALVGKHNIDWQWTKGHADDKWNNQADHLASKEAEKYLN